MPTSPLTLTPSGGTALRVLSVRLLHLAIGAWIADAVLDLPSVSQFPSGKVALSVGGVTMSGTTDPRNSGTFGPSARVRVVAGAGAWDTVPPAQDFHSDGGLTSTTVLSATASAIGETMLDEAPNPNIGIDYVRSGAPGIGPASRVFGDEPWWVDVTGVTHAGPRSSATADGSLFVRDFDPSRGLVTFSCDTLLYPGTPLSDPRFNGQTLTAWDVEQLFDANGSMGWTWTTPNAVNQLATDLKNATLEWTRAQYLRVTRYRLILYQGTRLALQAVTPSAALPNIAPISPYSGLAGASNMLSPSQEVLVAFENADPTLPRIVGYSLEALPLSTTIDAQAEVKIGPSAPVVQLAGGATPLVVEPWAADLASALAIFASAMATAATGPLAPMAAPASALGTALGTLPPPGTVKVVGA